MRKKTKFKSPVLDFFVVVLCLSVAGFFGYTFWKDLNSTARRTDKEKIAIITFKNRIAQRKFDDRVVWERIDKSTPLYNGDLVRTAELAEAVITFNDGSAVNIYENTMIQVYYSDFEGVQISVDNGNLELEASDKGKIQLILGDGSKVNASGGTSLSTKSTAGGAGASTVAVRNGSAVVTNNTGNSESLASGETVSVKTGGEIKKTPVTVTSIPSELRVLNVEGGDVPVKLEWNKKDESQPVVLQISSKKDYSVIKQEKVISSKNDELISLSEGTVYWRVFPQGHESEATEGKISVEEAKPLSLISPAADGVFQFRNRNPVLNFRWNGNDYAKNYLLKISSTPDMKTPVVEMNTPNPNVQIDTLGSGQWWWQVTPYYELNSLGYAGPSKISSFNIIKTEAITAPVLSVPLKDAEIHYKDTLSVNFSWKSDIKASYELLISDDKDFTDIISRKKTAGQRVSVNMTAPSDDGHTYYWKVIRNSSEPDDFNPESEVRSFSVSKYVNVPTKLLYPPEEYSTESSKLSTVRFMWKPADEAKNKDSIIQVAFADDFKYLQQEKKVSGNSLENLNLPAGDWYWRIGTQDEDGSINYTEPRHITILKELEAPKLTNVREQAEIVIAKNSKTRFSWAPVEGADFYNVRVFDSSDNLVAENAEVSGTAASFALPDNSYSIKIQAVAAQTESSPLRTGPVQTTDFSVRTPQALSAIAPAASARIDGLNALRTPTVFTWKAGQDKPASSELIIKKRMDDGSVRVVERIKTSKYTASVPRLTTGFYAWQIIASTKDGLPINSKEIGFTISPVASLAKPQLVVPAKAFVIDSTYLRKNRALNFEWKEVPDATEYNFIIYRKDKSGKLIPVYSEKSVKGTKVRLKKLTMFDVGDFEWNVTAYSYAKDGYEERRSPVAQGSFSVKFDSPKQITTEKTGRMYIGE